MMIERFKAIFMEKYIKIIEDEFGVNKLGSPWGSCTEKFLNEKIFEIANKYNFSDYAIELFKKNPYKFRYSFQHYSNGKDAGEYFVSILNDNK